MKKTLLSIFLTASSIIIAQDNWQTSISNGLTPQTSFNLIKNFHDTLFVAGKNSNSTFSIYKSHDGFNFAEEPALNSLLTNYVNNVSAIAANNNYLFLGTGCASSNSSANNTQVYKRNNDGSYAIFDSIRNYNLPVANQAYGSNFPIISGLQFYSPTGSNDSIYAFFSADPTYGNQYLSVWKSSLSTPHWAIANAFPSSSDFIDCKATVTWHGSLYASVTGYHQNTNYIISTNNGSTFTTVATSTATVFGSNPSASVVFSSFAIYHDTLMVSVSSNYTTNQPVFYTVDGTTWHPYFTSPISFDAVVDLKTFSDKLWVQVLSYSYDYPDVYYYSAKTGFKRSTAGTDLGENHWNSSFMLDTLNNSIYSCGANNYGSVTTSTLTGTSYSYGALFNLKPPTASFTLTSNNICSTSYGFIQNNSSNSPSVNWYLDGSIYSTSYTPTGMIPAGTYTLSLVTYNNGVGSISDSVSKPLTVYPGFNQYYPSQLIKPNSVCAGQTFTVIDTTKYTGANRPYTDYWQYDYPNGASFAGDSLQLLTDTMLHGGSSHTYGHYIVSSDGCSISTYTFTINVPAADNITGTISDQSNAPVTSGLVYLFKKQSTHVGIGDTTGYVNVSSGGTGSYTFSNILYGDYYLKAVADTNLPIYKNSVGTYYDNNIAANDTNYQWYNAVLINHVHCTGGNDSLKDIKIIQTPALTGNGVVWGSINITSSFNMRLTSPSNHTYGAPLKGVDVKLGKNPGGGCAAKTTATTGATSLPAVYTYTFTAIDTAYDYKIYVDIPNYGMDSVRLVTFNTSTVSPNNDYYVDSTMIRVQDVTGILKVVSSNTQLSLYPNPAADAAYIAFDNKTAAVVNLQLYDIGGKLITTLYNQRMQQGKQTVPLNLGGLQLNQGVYFIRASINNTIETVKLTIIGN